jgi:hypothetical protein
MDFTGICTILTKTYEMGQRKPFNPNTAYGRRKLREQARENFEKLPPDKQTEYNFYGCLITLIIMFLFGGCVYMIGGSEALTKWLK